MSKKSKYSDLSKNTLLFTISNFGTKIIMFLIVPLYTYVLSTNDYGNLDLVSTTVQLLVPLLTLNMQDAVLRFCLDKVYDPSQVVKVGIKVTSIASVILCGVLFLIYKVHLFELGTMYFLFLYFSFVTHSFYNIFSMYLKAVNKVKLLIICGLLNTTVTCLLNVVLLLVVKIGVFGYCIANIAGIFISLIIMLFGSDLLKSLKVDVPRGLFKDMLSFCLPLIASSVAWWGNNASDRYILAFFCGAAVNGVYSVAYKIPTILSTVQTIFYNAWSISAIKEFDKDDTDGFIGNVYTIYSCISILGCSFIMLFNVLIARILYAKDFFAAWQYVPPLLFGTVFNGIALFEGCIFTAVKKTKSVSITTILGSVVNTILNFALIPFIGALGAAVATMFGYLTIWIIRTVKLRGIICMKVNWKSQIISISILFIQLIVAILFKNSLLQIPFVIFVLISQRRYLSQVIIKICQKAHKKL